jgi:hypothetical protein
VGTAAKRPSTPTENSAPADGGGDALSQWNASDIGAYYYRVAAINRYGRSATVLMTGPVTSVLAHKLVMTVADGSTAGTAFEVYRSDLGGAATTCKYAFTVARTGATTVITDNNLDLPGCSSAFLIQQNLEYFSFKQLAPFMRIPLATIDLSIRWVQALYGSPTVYAPGKSIIYKNVGRASGSVGLNNAVA